MNKLLVTNIRSTILIGSILLSLTIFIGAFIFFSDQRLQTIRLTQTYALVAILYLYISLLISPLFHTFPSFPYQEQIKKARRSIGIGAFLFALLHALFAFFGQLGGFSGLPYLSNNYLLAISLAFLALQILFVLTITSADRVIKKMTFPRWKILHRLAYLAGILTLIHALMLGTHFTDLTNVIPQVFLVALSLLLILEAIRVDHYLQKRFSFSFRISIPLLSVVLFLAFITTQVMQSPEDNILYNIHAEHIKLAKESQQPQTLLNTSSIPGLTGDRTKRYTVSFYHPDTITAGEEVTLTFKVYDASSGKEVSLFNTLYEKKVHMIIADQTLTYFNHIHPEQNNNIFSINTSFPHNGRYHIYLDFQPFGAIEQQHAFTIPVGDVDNISSANHVVDTNLVKTFNDYTVKLSYKNNLSAQRMSVGEQELIFTISDAKTNNPVTSLQPYLAAFGHLVMINQETYDYIHVHPSALRPPAANEQGGPDVKFLPLGLYGPIKPGTYRVFAQFNPEGNLFTADFTISIK